LINTGNLNGGKRHAYTRDKGVVPYIFGSSKRWTCSGKSAKNKQIDGFEQGERKTSQAAKNGTVSGGSQQKNLGGFEKPSIFRVKVKDSTKSHCETRI